MAKKKAIVFDVDGTLIPYGKKGMDAKLIEILNTLKDDYYLFVATGRHMLELSDLGGVDFDAYITSDGQVVTINSGEVYASTIPKNDIENAVRYVTRNQIACAFTEMDEYYINFTNRKVEKYHDYVVFNTPEIKDISKAIDGEVLVVTVFDNDYEVKEILKLMPDCKMMRSNQYGADIVSAKSGKGTGLRKALKHFNISNKNVIAFGDGENDLDMFKVCLKTCAMGNGDETLKKEASYVSSDASEDGIINGLKYFKVLED